MLLLLLNRLGRDDDVIVPDDECASALFQDQCECFIQRFIVNRGIDLFIQINDRLIIVDRHTCLFLYFGESIFDCDVVGWQCDRLATGNCLLHKKEKKKH